MTGLSSPIGRFPPTIAAVVVVVAAAVVVVAAAVTSDNGDDGGAVVSGGHEPTALTDGDTCGGVDAAAAAAAAAVSVTATTTGAAEVEVKANVADAGATIAAAPADADVVMALVVVVAATLLLLLLLTDVVVLTVVVVACGVSDGSVVVGWSRVSLAVAGLCSMLTSRRSRVTGGTQRGLGPLTLASWTRTDCSRGTQLAGRLSMDRRQARELKITCDPRSEQSLLYCPSSGLW